MGQIGAEGIQGDFMRYIEEEREKATVSINVLLVS